MERRRPHQIRLFAGSFAPRGWRFCDGAVLPLNQNTALYSVLGTQYGGDGLTTFALPKLAPPGDAPANTLRYIICVDGIFPRRDQAFSATPWTGVTAAWSGSPVRMVDLLSRQDEDLPVPDVEDDAQGRWSADPWGS